MLLNFERQGMDAPRRYRVETPLTKPSPAIVQSDGKLCVSCSVFGIYSCTITEACGAASLALVQVTTTFPE
jgi:hypothetical protein